MTEKINYEINEREKDEWKGRERKIEELIREKISKEIMREKDNKEEWERK